MKLKYVLPLALLLSWIPMMRSLMSTKKFMFVILLFPVGAKIIVDEYNRFDVYGNSLVSKGRRKSGVYIFSGNKSWIGLTVNYSKGLMLMFPSIAYLFFCVENISATKGHRKLEDCSRFASYLNIFLFELSLVVFMIFYSIVAPVMG